MKPSVKTSACWIKNTYFISKFAEKFGVFSFDPKILWKCSEMK